jgi:hypothetical protein
MARTFEDRPAVREQTPLLVGLVGPSSSGKTYSALRIASGIQRVVGGDIFGIDTEARRMLHYADKFKFRHLAFGAPFSPLDYLDAIEHCVNKGAKTIVIDSMSHEHESVGGVLEMHEAELTRMAGTDYRKREALQMLAWSKPKQQRRKLINTILQLNVNIVLCFRAKKKLKMVKGQQPIDLGYQPIGGDEWIYECTLKCLLLPGANGTPTWHSEELGEKAMIKLPEQFRGLFASSPQLSEDIGQALAVWAAGTAAPEVLSADDLVGKFAACSDAATHRTLEESRRVAWGSLSKSDKARVKSASEDASARIERAARSFEASDVAPEDDSDAEEGASVQ